MKPKWLNPALFAVQATGAVAIIVYCIASGWRLIGGYELPALMFVGGAVVEVALPIIVVRTNSKAEFDAGSMFIVAAALLLPTQVATLAWAIGMPVGWALRKQLQLARLADTSNEIIACFVSLTVAHAIGSTGLSGRNVAAALLAGIMYDPLTLITVAGTHWIRGRVRFWSFVGDCLASELTAWPFLLCTGLILGVLGSSYPWTLPLAVAPLGLVFLASRSRVAASEDRARLDGLLRVTTAILEADTIARVIELVSSAGSDLLDGGSIRVDTEPPGQGEIGTPFVAGRIGALHLVASSRGNLSSRYDERDKRVLETMASVTASALAKAVKHEDATAQATRDPLTGLANRRFFEAELSHAGGRRATDQGWGIIAVDLDGFKEINDTYGHQSGDDVLVVVATRLAAAVRGGDVVSRLGGDEFMVLLRGVSNADEAGIVADRILSSLRKPVALGGEVVLKLTTSLGVALSSGRHTAIAQLLAAADAALYQAKRDGKDCWRMADQEAVASTSLA
jgi:diguanylate cyclase (GGDEF)-like protein